MIREWQSGDLQSFPKSFTTVHSLTRDRSAMIYWVHIARGIDRATLHRDRCSEVPSTATSSDFWEGGWFDYPDKERALHAMEQAGVSLQRRCSLCKP